MDQTASRRRRLLQCASAALPMLLSEPLRAQADYPSKPVRLIVPWPAGGGGDVVMRIVAQALSARTGQQVIVDNRPGATGTIGSTLAAKSAPDGYTLVYAAIDSHAIFPHLLKTPPYDTRHDFTPIIPVGEFPFALAVTPDLPVKTLQEFLDHARRAPKPLTYCSWGVGSSGQVTAELFKRKAGIELLHVPYQGTAPMLQALMAGEVACSIVPVPAVEQAMQAGKIRGLAAFTRERLARHPQMPTATESGIAMTGGTWIGIFGPGGMPAALTEKVHGLIAACLDEPEIRAKLDQLSVLPERQGVAAYKRFVDAEYERYGAFLREAGITLN